MNYKEFFKPTIRKIILFVLIFGFSSTYIGISNFECYPCPCGSKWGYPLIFLERNLVESNLNEKPINCGTWVTSYTFSNFVIDFISWYFISCLIIWFYREMRNRVVIP